MFKYGLTMVNSVKMKSIPAFFFLGCASIFLKHPCQPAGILAKLSWPPSARATSICQVDDMMKC
jgi:hypothetical protein